MNVEKLILGTVQLGLNYGVNNPYGQVSASESNKILKLAIENNILQLDSAEAYGSAHQRIGDFHQSYLPHKFLVNTKLSKYADAYSITHKIESFLFDLQVDYIETLMFHSYDMFVEYKIYLAQVKALKEIGMIKSLGVSIYTNDEFEKILEEPAVEVIQIPFNLLDNYSIRGALIEKAKSKNKIIHSRSAFLQGLFYKSTDDAHPIVKALNPQLSEIKKLSNSYNVGIPELALCYCLQQKSIDKVIIGVDSIAQLKVNLDNAQKSIPNELVEKINNIFVASPDLLNPSRW